MNVIHNDLRGCAALSDNQRNYQISYIISAPFPLSESTFPWVPTEKERKSYEAFSL